MIAQSRVRLANFVTPIPHVCQPQYELSRTLWAESNIYTKGGVAKLLRVFTLDFDCKEQVTVSQITRHIFHTH